MVGSCLEGSRWFMYGRFMLYGRFMFHNVACRTVLYCLCNGEDEIDLT